MFNIQSVLVACDFSEVSDRAIDYAAELCTTFGAKLTLLHVYSLPVYTMPLEGSMIVPPETAARLSAHLQEQLDQRAAKLRPRGLSVQLKLVMGVPYTEIVQVARDSAADLIVIGTHGRTGVAHVLLGSVAERVLRLAQTPVLTLH